MTKWWWKADYIETCNCAHGCSCNLTMLPTDGTCQGLNCWQIREGAYNGTRLDGLGIALINRWPNPIHRGNGRGVVFIDEHADEAQRAALSEIGSGKAGPGGPFEIFATTMSQPASVRFGRFRFQREGRRGLVELDEVARVQLGPLLSDMDQSEADAHLGLHHGLYCVACCWGLMLILVAVGVMNILAMAVLTIVIFAEKALRHGMLIARLTGVSFFGAAVVAVICPKLFPGLNACCPP